MLLLCFSLRPVEDNLKLKIVYLQMYFYSMFCETGTMWKANTNFSEIFDLQNLFIASICSIMLNKSSGRIWNTFHPTRHPEERYKTLRQLRIMFLKYLPVIQRFFRLRCTVWIQFFCCFHSARHPLLNDFLQYHKKRFFLWRHAITRKQNGGMNKTKWGRSVLPT